MPIVLQTDASDFFRGVALPLAGLFAFAVVGWFAVIAVRKAFRGEDAGADAFTLDELRRLHRSGELSDEEFARAKESMLGIARRARATDGPAAPAQPERREPRSQAGNRPEAAASPADRVVPPAVEGGPPPRRPNPVRPTGLGPPPDEGS